jgi:alkylhydroperoxidase family enzyme
VLHNPAMTINFERAFADRPEVFAAWIQINTAIKDGMDLRRYELVTLAAALKLRSSYCCLAHGRILLERFGEPVLEIVRDRSAANLDEVDLAVMELAGRVVEDATSIEDADLQKLRDLGLSDADIADVVYAASIRCFFSKTLDALCVQPDASFRDLPAELREALVVGRPIADA